MYVATLDVCYNVYVSCPYLARLSVQSLTYLEKMPGKKQLPQTIIIPTLNT